MLPPNKDKSKILYDAVSKKYDLGSYDEFTKKLQDPAKRKAFYEGVGKEYDLGSYQDFESKVVKKKEVATSPAPKQNLASATKTGSSDIFGEDKFLDTGAFLDVNKISQNKQPAPTPQPNKYKEGSAAWTQEKLKSDTQYAELYNRFKQAEAVPEDKVKAIREEVDAEAKNEGVWNNIKSAGRSFGNFLTRGSFVDEGALADEKAEAKKQLQQEVIAARKANKPAPQITEDAVMERAKELKVQKRLKSERDTQVREFLEVQQNTTSGPGTMNNRQRLALFQIGENSTLQENDKLLLEKQNILRPAIDNATLRLNEIKKEAKSFSDKGQAVPQELVQEFNNERENYQKLLDDAINTQEEYVSNKEKLGTATENLDLFKRDYGWMKNFEGNVVASTMDVLSGVAGFADYANTFTGRPVEAIGARAGAMQMKGESDELRSEIMKPIAVDDINSMGDFGKWLSNTVIANNVPIYALAATGYGGVGAIGASATGQKFEEMQAEIAASTEDYSQAQLLGVPALFGATETVSAAVDRLVFKNAGRIIRSASEPEKKVIAEGFWNQMKEASKSLAKSGKDIGKGVLMEGADEAGTQIAQNVVEKYLAGKEDVGIWDNVKDAAAAGAVMGGMIPTGATGISIASQMAKSFSTDKTVEQTSAAIRKLEQELGNPELSPTAKKVIEKRLTEAENRLAKQLAKTADKVSVMPNEEFEKVVSIENQKAELKRTAQEIETDTSLGDDTKEMLLDGLKDDYNTLEDKRLQLLEDKKPQNDTGNSAGDSNTAENTAATNDNVAADNVAVQANQAEPEITIDETAQESDITADGNIRPAVSAPQQNGEQQSGSGENIQAGTDAGTGESAVEVKEKGVGQRPDVQATVFTSNDGFGESPSAANVELNSSQRKQNSLVDAKNEFNRLNSRDKKGQKGSSLRLKITELSNDLGFKVKEEGGKISVLNDKGKQAGKITFKEELPESNSQDVTFAIQEIEKGVTLWSGDPYSPRVNLGISWADIRKGESDIKAGKLNTVPAKRLVAAIKQAKDSGGYEYIEGSGANINRSRVPIEEVVRPNDMVLTAEEEAIIIEEKTQLAAEYNEYFRNLDEETQNQILEEYENYRGETGGNARRGESQENVPNQEKGSRTAEPAGETVLDRIINQDEVKGLLDFLDDLKLDENDLKVTLPFLPQTWNTFIEAVKLSIKAGNTIRNAVNEAIRQLEANGVARDEIRAVKARFEELYKLGEEKKSALRNADIAEKRKELGLAPRETVERKSNLLLEQAANDKIKSGYDVETLIDEVLDINSTRALTNEEVIILKQYQLGKENQLIEIGDKVVEATREGKQTTLDKLTEERNKLVDDIDRAYRAGERSGTMSARALQIRRMAILYDYSLANMLIQRRKANGNEKLTPEQIDSTTAEYYKIKELNEKLQEKVKNLEEENNRLKAEQQFKKLIGLEKRRRGRKEKVEVIDKSIDDVLASIKKKVKEQQGRLSSNALPIEMIPDIAKLAVLYAQKGVVNLSQVVDNIYASLKDDIPNLTKADIEEIIASYDYEGEAKNNARLEALKKRTSKNIEELRKKLAEKNFAKQSVTPIKLDAEAQKLKDELRQAKFEWDKALESDRLAQRTRLEKAKDLATDILNVPRSVMASIDYSAPLRQGLVLTINHPILASRAFTEMFKQGFSQLRFDRWMENLQESPEYELIKKSGLYIAETNKSNAKLSAKEEQFMSNLAHKIPVIGQGFNMKVKGKPVRVFGFNPTGGLNLIGGSERAYVSYLNKLRVDVFLQAAGAFQSDGNTFEKNPELFEALGTYVNAATGRGDIGKFESSAAILNSMFFSPRLIASRVRLLTNWANPSWYAKTPARVRRMYALDMIRFIGAGTSILALAALAGADVEEDPRSSDFGKIKIGDTRYDIWGGFQQFVRYFAQIGLGSVKKGNRIEELNTGKFGKQTRADVAGKLFRSKLAPVPATIWNLAEGRDPVGQEYTYKDLPKLVAPLFASDLYKAIEREGHTAAATTGLPAVLGVGVLTYE